MILQSFDKTEIYLHEWAAEDPKGVVQIVHGMTEHGARYEGFARYLNEHGYFVVADDHRGHGKTHPQSLGYAPGDMFADTVRDEGLITERYRERFPSAKYFLFGFSYGSFLTQRYLADHGDLIDGAVIAGSNYKKDFEVYLGSLVAGMGCLFSPKKPAKLIEKLSFGAYSKQFEDGNWLSADADNNEAYRGDPFCGFTCSNRFYKDFFRGLRRLYTKKYCEKLPKALPLLLAAGKDDPVGDMGKGMEKLARFYREKAGMTNVRLELFEGCRHEFLNEKRGLDERRALLLGFFDEIVKQ